MVPVNDDNGTNAIDFDGDRLGRGRHPDRERASPARRVPVAVLEREATEIAKRELESVEPATELARHFEMALLLGQGERRGPMLIRLIYIRA